MKKKTKFREGVEALLLAGLAALTIRAIFIEAFKIPSGSMIPTLSIGDHIFVNKLVYGPRVPFTTIRPYWFRTPKRGEVVVYLNTSGDGRNFIKRVIGIPGDRIRIVDDQVTLNGETLKRKKLVVSEDPHNKRLLRLENGLVKTIPFVRGWQDVDFYEETIDGVSYVVQYIKHLGRVETEAVVPPDSIFVMGDNRDNSEDSRITGFVPMKNVKGKALFVWLSLDNEYGGIRWHEFGRLIR